MKAKLILIISILFTVVNGQTVTSQLQPIFINKNVTTHIISSQKIKYSDISVSTVMGHLPTDYILAVKPVEENTETGVLTIVCENFMKQYRLVYTDNTTRANSNFYLDEAQKFTTKGLTEKQLNKTAKSLLNKKSSFQSVATKGNGMVIRLNEIYTDGNYFFVDYVVKNRTNINYDVDLIKYKIQDRKITKATTSQTLEVNPITNTNESKHFSKEFRNIAVFDKFTIPDNKTFIIELAEEQISGRKIELFISYKNILNAKKI